MDLLKVGESVSLSEYLKRLWAHRHFMIRVPLEDLRAQNSHTFLGSIWLVLNPLLQVGVYFLVFGLIMPIDRGVDQYLVFLTIGVFVFFNSQRVISESTRSLVINVGLIRTVHFPRAVLPMSATVGQALAFIPVFVVMTIVVLAYGNWPHVRWLLILPVFMIQNAFSLGIGLIGARINHSYRDLENLLPFVFRLLFYISGVLYSVDSVVEDDFWRAIFLLNPMYCLVSLWRWVMVGTPTGVEVWLATGVWSLLALMVGLSAFRSKETTYGGTG